VVLFPLTMRLDGVHKIQQGDHRLSDGARGSLAIVQQIIHQLQVHLSMDQHGKTRMRGWGVADGSSGAMEDLAKGLGFVIGHDAELVECIHALIDRHVHGRILAKAHPHEGFLKGIKWGWMLGGGWTTWLPAAAALVFALVLALAF